jgi:hypothetical protein
LLYIIHGWCIYYHKRFQSEMFFSSKFSSKFFFNIETVTIPKICQKMFPYAHLISSNSQLDIVRAQLKTGFTLLVWNDFCAVLLDVDQDINFCLTCFRYFLKQGACIHTHIWVAMLCSVLFQWIPGHIVIKLKII